MGHFHELHNFLLQPLFGDPGLIQATVQALDLFALVVHVRLRYVQLAVEFCAFRRDGLVNECNVRKKKKNG